MGLQAGQFVFRQVKLSQPGQQANFRRQFGQTLLRQRQVGDSGLGDLFDDLT